MKNSSLVRFETGSSLELDVGNGKRSYSLQLLRADLGLLADVDNLTEATERACKIGCELFDEQKVFAKAFRRAEVTAARMRAGGFTSIICMHRPIVHERANRQSYYALTLHGGAVELVQFVDKVTPYPDFPRQLGLLFLCK